MLVRKKEIMDNVIPSSNAAFARVLLLLSEYYVESNYRDKAGSMLLAVRKGFPAYAPAYATWAQLLFTEEQSAATFAVVGPDAKTFLHTMTGSYAPHLRLAGSSEASDLPLLRNKYRPETTMAFRCQEGTCGLPAENWEELFGKECVQ
jgi:hypothetical protein